MATWHHHRVGAGEPLVLLHGVGARWQMWEPVVDILAASYDVIAVDLPGFGRSNPLAHTTVDSLTEALAEFLAAQGIDRPHLAGNSMGGLIALNSGARGLARSVTAFSPIGFWGTAGRVWCQQSLGKSQALARLARPTLPFVLGHAAGRILFLSLIFGKPRALDAQVALETAIGAVEATAFDEALASFSDARLHEIGALTEIPVTIAWGSRDILLTYATQSRRARRALPRAEHVTLRGSGHSPFFDDPAACAQVLAETIARAR
ncbi:alpha/beta fold hydrolase [Nocardia sp. R6R-6]|uniref:alpha/beta fold hydrolase n=1 Tax=Nocardia sp. R6R-6 TaxID=3459303 RepID=UPI00403E215B